MRLNNGKKIIKADAIAVMKLWAVEQSTTCIVRYEIKLHRKQIRNCHPKLAIPFFILTHSISIGLMNGEKIMEADAIAVIKLWAVDHSSLCILRNDQRGHASTSQ